MASWNVTFRSVPVFARAVAANAAVPGLFAPINIGDRRYIDGGRGSQTNADLIQGAILPGSAR